MSDHPQPAGASILDLQPPGDRVARLRRLPRLTWRALRLVWDAGHGHLIGTVLLQVAAAAAIGIQLLVSRELLRAVVDIGHGGSVSSLYPWLAAVAGCAAALGVIAALTTYEQKLLVELASRFAFDRIIDVSANVDLESFERPASTTSCSAPATPGCTGRSRWSTASPRSPTGVADEPRHRDGAVRPPAALAPVRRARRAFPLIATILNSGRPTSSSTR